MTESGSLLRLEKKELRWPLAVALVIIALTCLPYLFGWAITPPGFRYSGYLSNPDDHNVYFSYMRQAHDGSLVFVDQFTTEPQRPWFFHVFFLSLGLFSRISGLSLIVTYQLSRIIWGVLLLLALYVFGAHFLEGLRARRFFLLLIALSSGLGWLYLLIMQPTGNQPHPPDFGPGLVMPELITFLTLLLHPLFSFSVFLLVSTLLLLMLAMERRSLGLSLCAGVTGMLLANVHSYDSIPLAITILLYLVGRVVVQRRLGLWEIAPALILGVMMLPPLLYQFHLYRDLPVFRLKAEVATLSPPLLQYLLAMGLPFVFFIAGAKIALQRVRKQPDLLLPMAWFVALLISAYLPFSFQRKMAEGMQIPVCLLGALFLSERVLNSEKLHSTILQGATAAAILLFCFPSNGFFLGKALQDLQSMGTSYYAHLMPPPYLRAEQVAALEWL
ncbi:MAG: hypothetical protein GTO55_05880, partial [Armatimonadetes bacterium]|nr:hypothetical protein [Armatimonadota bacterium]NIM23783.1 hypothetical protein [Armatimonadota bacterium]NIM67660.1 hypothetical protein [Armatimonadota bacterium]NIM76176.1 hypothetical protein [Armatimonadota bacterium]NIN05861.1 hypothetical protein [Armatimonadota bacterium]